MIDYSRDTLLTDFAKITLADRYFRGDEESPQEMYLRTAMAFSDNEGMARRMYEYISKQWFSPASPILSNAPFRLTFSDSEDALDNFNDVNFKSTKLGMPISCFLSYVPDSREGLNAHYSENGLLSSMGGGIGGFWGDIRSDGSSTSNGSVSTGSIPFLHIVDSQMLAWAQGKTRRGSYAAYMNIDHPEIIEFLEMRKPTGGDINRKNLNLHQGIGISDHFMALVKEALEGEDPDWPLIDPNSGEVTQVLKVRDLWEKVLKLRAATGEPYIFFTDIANRGLPTTQRAKGLRVHHSNLCTEIMLATNEERTAVCCLSSHNLEKFDEYYGDEQYIYDTIRFMDNVLEYFIRNAEGVDRAVYSAKSERAIGIGALGFHSYLQSKNVPFESAQATGINHKIFKWIKEQSVEASRMLALLRGEPSDMAGTGLRNSHLLAIAPNASTSTLLNTSPSIEPWKANAFNQQTMSGTFQVKNKYLEALLFTKMTELNMDRDWLNDIWKSIVTNDGSVQHLDCLSDWEKDVYKTAVEIDQDYVISLAGDRQKYLCQAQSVNIFINQGYDIKKFSRLHTLAWTKELKSLYYCRSEGAKKAENLSDKVERVYLDAFGSAEECLSCEG